MTSKPWNTPGPDGAPPPLAGYQIKRGRICDEGIQKHNGKRMHTEPCEGFDWPALYESFGESDKERAEELIAMVRQEAMTRLLDFLVKDASDPRLVGLRAIMLQNEASREQSQCELADSLGLSGGRMSQLLKPFREEISAFYRKNTAPEPFCT